VDTADYTIWRDTLGSTTNLAADANLNGVIDSGDYQLWKANFGAVSVGAGASAGTTTPEPGCRLLGLLAAAAIGAATRRRCGSPHY
jgi:hypothetical protein